MALRAGSDPGRDLAARVLWIEYFDQWLDQHPEAPTADLVDRAVRAFRLRYPQEARAL